MNPFRFHQCLYRIIDTPKWLNLRKTILNKKQNGYNIQAWWRDDDICEDTNELDSLIRFVESNNIPAFLSVIPDKNFTVGPGSSCVLVFAPTVDMEKKKKI